MVLETLRYADEVNTAQGYFRDIADTTPDADLLDLAEALIEKKSGAFHPQDFHDRYVDALKDLVERKRKAKGGKIIEEKDDGKPVKGSNVVDLMAALRKSMGSAAPAKTAEKPAAAKKAPAKKAPAKSTPAKSAAAKKRA
jgi:DNA end-binding protein Ku